MYGAELVGERSSYIVWFHIPLDGIIPNLPADIDQVVIVISIGWSEQTHVLACQLFYFFMGFHDFVLTLFGGELGHLLVIFAMVTEIMSSGGDGFDVIGIFFDPSSCHKKCGADVILF